MKEIIDKIRNLLDELSQAESIEAQAFVQNFDALEIPEIVAAIVDHLQPELLPYEAAVYWHLFRKSILGTGQQYARASVRGLMKGVILSSSGQAATLSYKSVQDALAGLERKDVILKVGDTNREGTLYKILLPEEIAICQQKMKASRQQQLPTIEIERELDFYNVAENRTKIFEPDNYKCTYCGKQLTRFTVTLDHIQPVSKGGDNSFDNLVTSCLHCNSRRINRPVIDIIVNESTRADA